MMYQLLKGIEYLHDRHVSHRGPSFHLVYAFLTGVFLDLKVGVLVVLGNVA